MNRADDPFIEFASESLADDFKALRERAAISTPPPSLAASAIGRLQGFDLLEQPLVGQLAALPGQVVPARSAVPLRRALVGHEVLVLFADGDPGAPVIVGVVQPHPLQDMAPAAEPGVVVQVDGERHVIAAEREIVLRCGDASITLTRAGKVIIAGTYILSRSSGYNKIKGAAVDIN